MSIDRRGFIKTTAQSVSIPGMLNSCAMQASKNLN